MANGAVHDAAEKGVAAARGKIDETVAAAAAAAFCGQGLGRGQKKWEQEQDRAIKLFLLFYIALAYWALVEYFWLAPFPQGHFVRCQLVYVVAAPLYKPLAFPMWTSLMAVAHFAFGSGTTRSSRGRGERHYTGVYPGESSSTTCGFTWFAVFLVMLPFLAWLIVAVVFFIPRDHLLPAAVHRHGPGAGRHHVRAVLLLGNMERVVGVVMMPTVVLGIVVVPVAVH